MMDKAMETQLKRYYREIKREIPKSYHGKEDILKNIQKNIESFLEGQPDVAFNDILSQFGNAEEIVSSFIDDMPAEEITALLKKERKKRYFTWAFCAVSIIILGSICCHIYRIYMNEQPFIIEDTLIIYPETEYIETETNIMETEH